MPRFSVVVPTRDRPDLLDFCLESLAAQTFDDFEVIVSDNPVQLPARTVFDRWARPGWRYVRAERPLPMHDNFERGCAEARGEYVAVVIDKTVLHPSALEVADRSLAHEPGPDLITWRNEGYDPVDEQHDLGKGRFRPDATIAVPALYEPAAELARRFSNATRRGVDPVHYVRGKIVFGAYARTLLDRIRACAARVFHPLAPDYTAMVPACVLSEGGLDLGRPLVVSYNSARSNGRRQGIDPVHARRFIEAIDPAIIDALPIPGLYASHHNFVAYDLVSAAERCPPGTTPPLHEINLVRRAREDLDGVVWTDPDERAAQYAIVAAEESRLGVTPPSAPPPPVRTTRAAIMDRLNRFPPLGRVRSMAAGRNDPPRPIFTSPLDAAREADRHYAALGVDQ
ncbi:MAG: glycosyltransferase family 2 protein [Actinomycetota bacterium]|nr:glycosyltransferase family 2 protein [Actinomycetota bacterium]